MTRQLTRFQNANLLTLDPARADYGLIENGVLLVDHAGKIEWLGTIAEFERLNPQLPNDTVEVDLCGHFVSPGLIDCHTHLIFGGSRADEWQMRLQGASYEQIARAGGGILSTVKATRQASEQELVESGLKRARQMLSQGVTTLEVKSGYGLDLDTELKILHAAEKVASKSTQDFSMTFLGVHAVPPEFVGEADQYIDFVTQTMLPQCAPLVQAVDVFCEGIGFDLDQTRRVFDAAQEHGLAIKIHSEQLSLLGGTRLAAVSGAWSADHLEYLDAAGVEAMAEHGTVAVLLPAAYYFINETRKPPVALLRKSQVPIAVATDLNPGSSPAYSLPLMMNFACTLFGLTPLEAFRAVTIHAARALRLQDRLGSLTVGKQADLAVWDIESAAELAYGIGHQPCRQVYKNGKRVFDRATTEVFLNRIS